MLMLHSASLGSNKETQSISYHHFYVNFFYSCAESIQSGRRDKENRGSGSSISLSEKKETEDCVALLSFPSLSFSCSSFPTFSISLSFWIKYVYELKYIRWLLARNFVKILNQWSPGAHFKAKIVLFSLHQLELTNSCSLWCTTGRKLDRLDICVWFWSHLTTIKNIPLDQGHR